VAAEPSAGPGATVRLAGIPIRIEPAFVLVLGFLGFAGRGTLLAAIEWIVLAGISIVLHELGHAAAYRRFGIQPRIRLWSFGGLTYGERVSPARSIIVSLAGPVTGILVGVAVVAVSAFVGSVMPTRPPEFELVVADLLYINVGWSLFNLLPVLPLDGGNVAAALARAAGRGEWMATSLSLVVAGAISVGALLAGESYIAIVGVFLLAWNWQARAWGREEPQRRLLARAWNRLARDPSAAVSIATELAATPVSADIKFEAIEILGWAALASGSTADVRDAFGRLGDGTVGSRLFRACTRLTLDGDGRGMAEALAAGTIDRNFVSVSTIATRTIIDAGLVEAVIVEAGDLAEPERWNSLMSLQVGLHENGLYADSVRVGTSAYEGQPDLEAAYSAEWTARSLSLAGDEAAAVTWLGRAIERGMAWSEVSHQDDFAALAGDPAF
jgi:Zn-dependent protease